MPSQPPPQSPSRTAESPSHPGLDTVCGTSRTVALVVLVVTSAVVAGVGAAQEQDQQDTPAPADEVYVTEDGDAVLVYAAESNESEVAYDLDVDSGLAHGLVTDPTVGGDGLQAEMTATATRASLQASGDLALDRPEALTALALDVSTRTNHSVARADAVLNTTFAGEDGFTQFIESAETSGEVTTTASRLRATGQFDAELVVGLSGESSYEARLTESDGGYTLSVEEERAVGQTGVERWQNRSTARETLERRQGALARSLGGSASVSIDSYAFDSGADRPRLDVAYTVAYRGIDAGLEAAVRSQLIEDPSLNESQADRIADAVTNVTVEELAVRYETGGGEVSGSVGLDVADYDDLALAYLDAAASVENETQPAYAGNVERARTGFEAQRAAGLEQRLNWSGALTHPDSEATQVRFEYHERTTNRSAYVDELTARGVETYNSSLALSGAIEDDTVVMNGSAEASGEGIFEGATAGAGNATGDGPGVFVDALGRSEPQKAKLGASVGPEGLTVEAGGAFGDLGTFRDTLAAEQDLPALSDAVGRTADGETTSYVRVPGAVPADPSEDDVRSLSAVNGTTAVNMPGEWDREFPTVDTERASEFLGTVPGRNDASASRVGFGAATPVGPAVVVPFAGR
jgi:hypothetical protein